MVPITEQGLDFLFVKDRQQQQQQQEEGEAEEVVDVSKGESSSNGSKGVVKYHPTLPQLTCLALSGKRNLCMGGSVGCLSSSWVCLSYAMCS
jgi:hypothetical protein